MGSNNKFSRVILFTAIAFFLAFAQYACSNDEKSSEDTVTSDTSTEKGNVQLKKQANGHQVIVYYFHGKFRCQTCKRIEQLTREAVSENFGAELSAGALEMRVINVEVSENSHFSKDYKLFTRSVVVSDMVNGKETQWKNLQKVWELVHQQKAFKDYIRDEIRSYLS
jgi:thiol-disulfide isomerase/thioredoxin